MATTINFPDNPGLNDTYTYGDVTFKFDGTHWYVLGASVLTLSTGKVLVGDISNKASEVNWSDKANAVHSHSIDYTQIANDLKGSAAVATSNIDWSTAGVFTKTITGALTLTFSNLQLNKVITFVVSGNFTITLPAYCNVISGTYDGTVPNYIQFHCTNSGSGNEQVWVSINQEAA